MDELRKNQTYTVEIDGYSSSGAGVCRVNGRAVFVERALVNELWEILILKVTSSAAYAKGIKLLRPSPDRIAPPCPAFGKCGGCDLQHMSYDEELRFKLSRVNDAFARIAGMDFRADEILGADDKTRERYRNKAIYAIGSGEGGVVSGFFRERSHEIVPAPDCLIQTELSVRCAAALRGFMSKTGVTAYDEKSGKGQIRHLFTRCSVSYPQSVAVIVSAKGLHEHTQALVDNLRSACPELTGIVLCINKTRGNTVLSGEYHTLWGSESIEDELCGLRFRISPQSFFQINPKQAERLYTRALEYAGTDGSETMLDLYCGTGTISLCLARRARYVYGVEIVEEAVINARENAERNGITNAEFFCGDAGDAAKMLAEQGVVVDAVVVDPPRKGLFPDVIDIIAEIAPQRVVYVSCDCATLARDMKRFAEHGYAPEKATAVDMFPRTSHVETVVSLVRKNPDDYIRVKLDLDDLDLTASESKATYPEIKQYVLEKYGLKVSSLYIAQVKQKYGIIEREHYNISKKENAIVPQCPKEKEEAITDALKHFKMI